MSVDVRDHIRPKLLVEFFEDQIGLEVTIDQIEKPVIVSEQEARRANWLLV